MPEPLARLFAPPRPASLVLQLTTLPPQTCLLLSAYLFHLFILTKKSIPFPFQLLPNNQGLFLQIGLDSLAGIVCLGFYVRKVNVDARVEATTALHIRAPCSSLRSSALHVRAPCSSLRSSASCLSCPTTNNPSLRSLRSRPSLPPPFLAPPLAPLPFSLSPSPLPSPPPPPPPPPPPSLSLSLTQR